MRVRNRANVFEGRVPAIVCTGFGVIGVLLCLVSVILFVNSRAFFAEASEADGVVVELVDRVDQDSDGNRSVTFAPRVEFSTPAGEPIVFTSSTSSSPARYNVGDEVKVFYDPADPQNAKIDGWLERWLAPSILLGIGLTFLLVALVIWRVLARVARLMREQGIAVGDQEPQDAKSAASQPGSTGEGPFVDGPIDGEIQDKRLGF